MTLEIREDLFRPLGHLKLTQEWMVHRKKIGILVVSIVRHPNLTSVRRPYVVLYVKDHSYIRSAYFWTFFDPPALFQHK